MLPRRLRQSGPVRGTRTTSWVDRPGTWLAMVRDVPDSVRVEGESHLSAGMILDVDSGLIRGVAVGRAGAEALADAIRSGLTRPAGDLPPGRPSEVACSLGLKDEFQKAWESVPEGGIAPSVYEVEPPDDAQDIFDSFLGHMAGRNQPADAPAPGDWALLYGAALEFYRSRPWDRWHDAITLSLEVKVGGPRRRFAVVVMGNSGVQHGLALYPGDDVPPGLRGWEPGALPRTPTGSLACTLDEPSDLPADIRAKAARYGWPADADLVPAVIRMGPPDEAGDPGAGEVQLLTVALTAVRAHDARGPVRTGPGEATTGSIALADGGRARFWLRQLRRPQASDQPQFRMHEAGHDLVPEGTPVVLGHLTWDSLTKLRTDARIHRPFPTGSPRPAGPEVPLVAILPRRRGGEAVAAKTAQLDPFGVSAVLTDDGQAVLVLVGSEGAEIVMEVDADGPGMQAFRRRMRATKGLHVVMVADESTSRGEGEVYGLFECHQAPSPPVRTTRPRPTKPLKRPRD